MARNKKGSRQGSVTPSVASAASESQNDIEMADPLSEQHKFVAPENPQAPLPEVQEENVEVSFQSRHNLSAETPKEVGKGWYGAGRQMHQRAGLVFNCIRIKKALKKGNFADRIQTGKRNIVK